MFVLNPNLTFLVIESKHLIVSSLDSDSLVSCISCCNIIKYVSQGPKTIQNISSQPFAKSPSFNRKLNSLIAHKIIQLHDEKVNYSDSGTPLSFFPQLFEKNHNNHSKWICGTPEKAFIVDFSKSCIDSFKYRILSNRPLLQYALSQKDLLVLKCKSSQFNVSVECENNTLHELTDDLSNEIQHKIVQLPLFDKQSQRVQSIDVHVSLSQRLKSAEETIQTLSKLVDPITGVIQKLKKYGCQNDGVIHNYTSGRNSAFSSNNLDWIKASLRSANGGKGTNARNAQASALCESIERYSMLHHSRNSDFFCQKRQLTVRAIEPNSILNFSESQYLNKNFQDKSSLAIQHWIPKKFNSENSYHWSLGYSMTHEEEVCIPSEIVYAQFSEVNDEDRIAMPDSNGCAAGSTLEEAIYHATLELIERDAVSIWWYNQVKREVIDIDSMPSKYIKNVKNTLSNMGRDLQVIDITSDVNVPTFAAVSYSLDSHKEIVYGFGSNLDVLSAIERSVTEVCQLLPAIESKTAQQSEPEFFTWIKNEIIEAHPHLYTKKLRTLSYFDVLSKYQVEEHNLLTLINYLKKVDIELITFDLTMPDINFNVARVFAPGLRHFWRRTNSGRLYQVPVNMGYQKSEKLEVELNTHNIVI